MDKYFPNLFKPGYIGKLRIKNRIVMLPMARQFQGVNGEVTQKTIDYFEERAKGGAGLIIVGSSRVFPPGHQFFGPTSLNLSDVRYLPGHCELVQAVHAHGAEVGIQFGHVGGQTLRQPVAASDVPQFFCDGTPYPKPRPLTRSEIYDVIDLFAKGALMARTAGYDMVEIHGAHDYLFGSFMSPKLNRRTDEFGGSLENRMRFVVETVKQIKRVAGSDFPVCVRISADDYVEGSITIDESPKMAKILEEAGVDVISASAGAHETQHLSNDITRMEEGFKRPLWEAIKKAVSIPAIAGGGNRNPDKCEAILADGIADFVGLARALIADPEWPRKAMEGRVDDIRGCLSCGECLYKLGGTFIYPLACSVNAAFGRERGWSEVTPAPVRKKVVMVGGGVAGMEAARIASLRGHRVTLYEKENGLGGQLLLAASPPGKQKLLWLRDYLVTQLEKQAVEVKLSVEVTPELLEREQADVLVIATGAKPWVPDTPGIEAEAVVGAWHVLKGEVEIKNKKIVILGGGEVGCETAEFLAQKGNGVTVIEMLPLAASDMEPTNRRGLLDSLKELKVRLLTNLKVEEIITGGVKVVNTESGEVQTIKAEAIVLALGSQPERDLADRLEKEGIDFYTIGDCQEPGRIKEAIYEGSLIGRQV